MENKELSALLGEAIRSELYDFPEPRRVFDVERFAYILATFDSARYFTEHMAKARNLVKRDALLEFAAASATNEGAVLEFGVGEGDSLRVLSRCFPTRVIGFDSFEGLPEDWDELPAEGTIQHGRASAAEPPAECRPGDRAV